MANNEKAQEEGRLDARTFAEENPQELEQVLEPGQLGADEALINGIGLKETAKLFGVELLDAEGITSQAFTDACEAYNRAFDAEIARLVKAGAK